MNKVQTSLQLDTDKLSEAKKILKNLGLNFTHAVKIPTKEFKKSIGELTKKDGKSFKNVNELFKDLDS